MNKGVDKLPKEIRGDAKCNELKGRMRVGVGARRRMRFQRTG